MFWRLNELICVYWFALDAGKKKRDALSMESLARIRKPTGSLEAFCYPHVVALSKQYQSWSGRFLPPWPLITPLGHSVESSAWYRKFWVYCNSVHCHCIYLWSSSSHYLLKIFQWFPTAYRKVVQSQPAIQGPLYLISAYCFPSHILIRRFLLTYRKTKRIVFPWNTRGICILCILSPISSWPKSLCSLRLNSNLYRIPPSKLLLLLRTLLAFHLFFKGLSFPSFHPVISVLSLSRCTLSSLGQNISQIGLWFLTVLRIALYF